MKPNQPILLVLLGALALSAGCAGTGPNTQQGAVGGALAGAAIGGVIGNNRGSGNALSGAAIGAAAGGLAGGAVGNSLDHQRGTLYDDRNARSVYDNRNDYVIEQPPPAPPPMPREVVTVRPGREAVWVAGYYAYVGRGRYEWVPGHWEVPPGRYTRFEQPRWERRGNSYVYMRGVWR